MAIKLSLSCQEGRYGEFHIAYDCLLVVLRINAKERDRSSWGSVNSRHHDPRGLLYGVFYLSCVSHLQTLHRII